MKQSKLRLIIIAMCGASWLLTCASVGVAPFFIGVETQDILDGIQKLTKVWMPIFICFGLFWFPRCKARQALAEASVSRERTLAALAFMALYLAMLLMVALVEVYGFQNRPELSAPILPRELSFVVRMDGWTKWAALISPLGTAPVIWLTGISSPFRHVNLMKVSQLLQLRKT